MIGLEQTKLQFLNADLNYFDLFTVDAVFLGTDSTERWGLVALKEYALPYFEKGQGWTYLPISRHVHYSPDQTVAWFDEILDSPRFGTARSSGVLLLQTTKDGNSTTWKVSQYHLTVPIPNDKMDQSRLDTIDALPTKLYPDPGACIKSKCTKLEGRGLPSLG